MKLVLKIFKQDKNLCLDVTDFAREMGIGEGDVLEVKKTTNGVELVSPKLLGTQVQRVASDFMGKYPNAMKRLAV